MKIDQAHSNMLSISKRCCFYFLVIFSGCIVLNYSYQGITGPKIILRDRFPFNAKILRSVNSLPKISDWTLNYKDSRRTSWKTIVINAVDDVPDKFSDKENGPILHYVFVTPPGKSASPFKLHHFLSVRSGYLRLRPRAVYLHIDGVLPPCPYFSMIKPMLSKIITWKTSRFAKMNDHTISSPAHRSDIVRLFALQKYGGIYMDVDVFVLRSFDPLVELGQVVLGRESIPLSICNAVIVAQKNAEFLNLWMNAYKNDYQPDKWTYNSGTVPYRIGHERKDLITFVDKLRFFWPDYSSPELLYREQSATDKLYQFDLTYSLHVSTGVFPNEYANLSPHQILTVDNSFYQVLRALLPPIYFQFQVTIYDDIKNVLHNPPSTILQLMNQTFSLFEVIFVDQDKNKRRCDYLMQHCSPKPWSENMSTALWKIELELEQNMSLHIPSDFLEGILNQTREDNYRSFQYTTQNGVEVNFIDAKRYEDQLGKQYL